MLDTGSALMWQAKPTLESMLPYYVTGIDLILFTQSQLFSFYGSLQNL